MTITAPIRTFLFNKADPDLILTYFLFSSSSRRTISHMGRKMRTAFSEVYPENLKAIPEIM